LWAFVGGYLAAMSESLRATVVYESGEDGWIVVSSPEVPLHLLMLLKDVRAFLQRHQIE
jgi:hypothetical protein